MPWKSWWKAALTFAALIVLAGNFAAISAQTRPEAPPFDASRMTMQPPPPGGSRHPRRAPVRSAHGNEPRESGDRDSGRPHHGRGSRGPRENSRGRARDRPQQRNRAAGPDRPARAPDAESGAQRRARAHRRTALRAGGFVCRLHDAPGHEFAIHLRHGRIARRHQQRANRRPQAAGHRPRAHPQRRHLLSGAIGSRAHSALSPGCRSGRTRRTSIRRGWPARPFANIRTTAPTGSRFTTRKIMKEAATRCPPARARSCRTAR